MSNCTQQWAGCQKGRHIKAGRLYYMKLLLITQSQKQKTNRQKYRQTDRHNNINTHKRIKRGKPRHRPSESSAGKRKRRDKEMTGNPTGVF